LSVEKKRLLIEPGYWEIPIYRQCDLIGLPRSSYYYEPAGETEYNLLLMRLLDEQYTRTPFYGVPRMTEWLRSQGYMVNHKRVERLMGIMGLQAIYPKPKLSKGVDNAKKYPYLLNGLLIQKPDQVWCSDITYIRLRQGFIYLVAIMDWFSRYVLSWEVSNSLDAFFCLNALERALLRGSPEIFNNDQGSQFTSQAFTNRLEEADIRISWDGRGRLWDNIFIERLWRTVKYEEVFIKDYETVAEAVKGLSSYFRFYNNERFHQSLEYRTPLQVYTGNSGG
jgi:putative transposase